MRQRLFVSRLRAVALLALLVGMLFAASASAEKRYRDDVFKRITTTTDLIYGSAPVDGVPQELKLDLRAPKRDQVKKRPAVIWVHGGGFSSGDKADGPALELAKAFARKGYVTASINTRLLAPGECTGAGGVSPECYSAAIEAVHDAQAAVRYLRLNAKRLGIDRKRIAIGGESAGAITACGVAVLSADPGASGNPGPSSAVGSFSSISGGLPGGIFVDANTAPGILFASVDDPVVPLQWSIDTQAKMASFGIESRLTTFPGSDHVPTEQYGETIERQSARTFYADLDLARAQG
jgi:predicted esterase